jgi:3-phosphoshikimate 1-carboxyvinyltransferase
MTIQTVSRSSRFQGSPRIPGDKSISHRGLIFGALSEGITTVSDILESGDVQSTARCLTDLGVKITKKGRQTLIEGIGTRGFKTPSGILDCGNSGTTIRLLMGVLAGREITATLTGDSSLVRRPMKRVAEPLRRMGAQLQLTNQDYAPLTVQGAKLAAIDYELKIASAQLKTSVLLAALTADGTTRLTGEILSRDHTERLLGHFGVAVACSNSEISLKGGQKLQAAALQVPGDPSTASFWMGAASIIPGSRLEMANISLNPTRIGFLRALQRMGAEISIELTQERPEPIGRITVTSGKSGGGLRGVRIERSEVPSLIDELPLLAVLATQAHGVTEVEGAEELRVKESDRIEAVATNLRAMGARIEVRPDGFRIEGPQKLHAARIESYHDHRIAMAFSIAALVADETASSGPTSIEGADCVGISYPEFFETLTTLTRP